MSGGEVFDIECFVHSDSQLDRIAQKIYHNERIGTEEGIMLFHCNELGWLSMLATHVSKKWHKNRVYYNKNLHIEPTNVCIYKCLFCGYSKKKGEQGGFERSIDEIISIIESHIHDISEVHIVGGVHPDYNLQYYCDLFSRIKKAFPSISIKALTAIELHYIFKKESVSVKEGMQKLIASGLDYIPGGGAEIFDAKIRNKISKEKASSEEWLTIHKTAHQLGIRSNATMLFGHIENINHRVDHMNQLRKLQDETHGFNAFIPLKYRNYSNTKLAVSETTVKDVLLTFAVSRLFLDNIPHIKAYWPDIGLDASQLALSFGADDLDGTIQDTKIYSPDLEVKIGVNEQKIVDMIKETGKVPVKRDTHYNIVKQRDV